MAKRIDLPDVSSLVRTLVQADRMGTSIGEALRIISEEMRFRRFQRAENQALKVPIKILFPLLVFIMPVVLVVVAGPIFIQFMSPETGAGSVIRGIAGSSGSSPTPE
jgi:tight adherence protein C